MWNFVLPLLLIILWCPVTANAQSVKTDVISNVPRTVKRISSSVRAEEIAIFGFEFQRPYFGYEGPNFRPIDEEPSAGTRYFVRATLFRQEAIATAKFELVDESGLALRVLRLSKFSTSISDGDYVGFVQMPAQAFRIAVSGMDINGKPYRRVHKRTFQPTTNQPVSPELPPGLPPLEVEKVATALTIYEQQVMEKMDKASDKHPDGVIVMPRVHVSKIIYEPLLSDMGNQLGIRLNYDVIFSVDGDYAHSLDVSPDYDDLELRRLVKMNVAAEKITPMPEPPSYATPQIHVDLRTLIKYASMAQFKGGIAYHFTIDFVPDFIGQNDTNPKFCVNEEHYITKGSEQRVWEAMKANKASVKYWVVINKLDFAGETEQFFPPKTFYDSFIKEETVKCKSFKSFTSKSY